MHIKLIAVEGTVVPTAKGNYTKLEVTYKNLTYGGKTETKLIMSFGAQKAAFEALKDAASGEEFTVSVQKNAKGYNDWISVVPGVQESAPAAAAPTGATGGRAATASPRNTYETPEERAKRQIYIVRQSSISNAIELLTTGAKTPPAVADVIKVAQEFESYVFGDPVLEAPKGTQALANMEDEIPY